MYTIREESYGVWKLTVFSLSLHLIFLTDNELIKFIVKMNIIIIL